MQSCSDLKIWNMYRKIFHLFQVSSCPNMKVDWVISLRGFTVSLLWVSKQLTNEMPGHEIREGMKIKKMALTVFCEDIKRMESGLLWSRFIKLKWHWRLWKESLKWNWRKCWENLWRTTKVSVRSEKGPENVNKAFESEWCISYLCYFSSCMLHLFSHK